MIQMLTRYYHLLLAASNYKDAYYISVWKMLGNNSFIKVNITILADWVASLEPS